MSENGICIGCGGEAVEDRLCETCLEKVDRESDFSTPDDNLCAECDSTGEIDGRVCRSCQGKGYITHYK